MVEIKEEFRKALVDQLRKAASHDLSIASPARAELAKAIEQPIRKVLLSGDVVSGIFTPEDYSDASMHIMYLLDLLVPGQEREFYAYTLPDHGAIPMRRVEADYLEVPTYEIGSGIDITLKILRNANWNMLARMMEILEAGFVKKMNDDGWQTILGAAVDRNILVNDVNAAGGQFTPRLVTLAKTFMHRNGGGNSATRNRAKATDMYVSPEALDDIRSWGLELIPDAIRARIYDTADESGDFLRVFGTNIHALDEFGEGQEYQQYYTGTLAASIPAGDSEVAIVLDRQASDSFVNPWRNRVEIFEDDTVHRRRLFSLYGWAEMGWAVLDSRRVMLASF